VELLHLLADLDVVGLEFRLVDDAIAVFIASCSDLDDLLTNDSVTDFHLGVEGAIYPSSELVHLLFFKVS
jgi:hypothetical protein